MGRLTGFAFTPLSDWAFSDHGWYLELGDAVDSLAGDDEIIGVDLYGDQGEFNGGGIVNNGLIETGIGADSVEGTGTIDTTGLFNGGIIDTGEDGDTVVGVNGYEGDGLLNEGVINTGSGDDVVRGIGSYRYNGVVNLGSIYGGSGHDLVRGSSSQGFGISNHLRISTGSGDDAIIGYSEEFIGISNGVDGLIRTGDGSDLIESSYLENRGLIHMGSGIDTIDGFLANEGVIRLGAGNDRIMTSADRQLFLRAISNSGLIAAGAGRDVVNGLGGLSGDGTMDLGAGNDRLKGFGSGLFRGGKGVDTLIFNPGTYQVVAAETGGYLIDQQMRVLGFERFGQGAGFLNLSDAAALGSVTFI